MHFSRIILTGPTASGKTELIRASRLCGEDIEIVNADMGQMYAPCTIGTAKPSLSEFSAVPHHLFNILTEPRDMSVAEYRELVCSTVADVESRGKTPIIVGGSLFYIASLFFPPRDLSGTKSFQAPGRVAKYEEEDGDALWQRLAKIDPSRAREIHPNDTYRIKRALYLWRTTGQKPSSLRPRFTPMAEGVTGIVYVTRERDALWRRICRRTHEMLSEGWLEEVVGLSPEWKSFLVNKGLIGYPEIIAYLDLPSEKRDLEVLVDRIQRLTYAYAKRQRTFWRSLRRRLCRSALDYQRHSGVPSIGIEEVTLTSSSRYLYLEDMVEKQGEQRAV